MKKLLVLLCEPWNLSKFEGYRVVLDGEYETSTEIIIKSCLIGDMQIFEKGKTEVLIITNADVPPALMLHSLESQIKKKKPEVPESVKPLIEIIKENIEWFKSKDEELSKQPPGGATCFDRGSIQELIEGGEFALENYHISLSNEIG